MSAPTPIGRPHPSGGSGGIAATATPTVTSSSSSISASSGAPRKSSNRGQSTPYFSDNKRSEVNELRTALRSLDVQRDVSKYRETCQRVIHYMTLGIDVSRLFTEMVMASATQDLVQKKLVYLYLCNYAESHSELTLLAINTLQKNCRDHNPMVRGLALRSMCGLRVENLVEYVLQPLQDGLRDKSAYVRKTAVLGCIKLFYTSENVIHECNIPDTLYAMLKDRDELVVANAVVGLEEILASEGGIVLTKEIAHRLLVGLKNFPTWSQAIMMSILVRYVPSNEDEVFDILNILDDRLKSANSGVVLAAAKLFLHFTRNMSDMMEDVYERIKVPLITQMSSGSPELCYTLLHHLQQLLFKFPTLLENDYASFFCRYNEPSFVKTKKLEILTSIVTPGNMEAIVQELAAYITDVDVVIARLSIKAMGKIAVKYDDAVDHIFSMLLLFLDLDTSYISADTLSVLQDLLRKYPDEAERVVARLPAVVSSGCLDEEPDARCALLWILGEHGELIDEAPYILEEMVENIAEETSHKVRLQLLTTCMKLFFKRMPEMQKTLGQLLESTIDEDVHQDVHDRGLLYYRLLRTDINEAKRIVASPAEVIEDFAEDDEEQNQMVFEEFNSLSVIYNLPASTFVDQRPPFNTVGVSRNALLESQQMVTYDDEDDSASKPLKTVTSSTKVGNLLDGDMFTTSTESEHLPLNPTPALSPQEFEKKWTSVGASLQIKDVLKQVPSTSHFERQMTNAKIKTLAVSPPTNGLIKFFLYAQELETGNFHLMEVVVDVTTKTLTATFKSDLPDAAPNFAIVFRGALSGSFEAM